ncbi:hypothetical protein TSUD_55370 [Trifolium subterraneum]|uniref:Peptidase S26 domain-containing protein n=1 Tax=Trifolium subterraneum TaxID=3900 RepID=A0A2Z6M4K8_TRISU|nr:hypothetical protein TSUD_55370 [Trifolium subterraneum]
MSFMNHVRTVAKEALERTSIIAKFLCCLHFTGNYLCSPTHAYGPSMLPTLNIAGDVVLVEHLSPRIGKVGYGDLVLVRSPLNPNRNLTKRVVAMEGDTVTYFDPLNSDSSRIAVIHEMTSYWKLTNTKRRTGVRTPVMTSYLTISAVLPVELEFVDIARFLFQPHVFCTT